MQTVIDLKEKFRNSSTNRDVVAAGEQIMEMDYWRFQSLKRYQIQEMCRLACKITKLTLFSQVK